VPPIHPDPLVRIDSEPNRGDEYRSPLYELRNREIWFSKEALAEQKRNRSSLWHYLRTSRFFVGLTAPFIYGCIIPFVLIDIFISIFQFVAFPIYDVPKVRRGDYIVFDRGRLCYLNLLERINCAYCSYGNGVLAYVVEIAARTEQHWCPIRHAFTIHMIVTRISCRTATAPYTARRLSKCGRISGTFAPPRRLLDRQEFRGPPHPKNNRAHRGRGLQTRLR